MTETSHTRSRRTSLYGLLLQIVVFAGVLAMAQVSGSSAMFTLALYMAGGIPIWFVSLLVFWQRELAALEAMDLEELRREKQATGGGEAIFDQEGGGALGLRVAEARLHWMQRWLVPALGLLNALYLAIAGLLVWYRLEPIRSGVWAKLENLPITMIVLAVVMLLLLLFSRYTSGMGRQREWQLLRACGSYMLGNALAALALIICLGVYLYTDMATAERVLAYVLGGVMLVLAVETLFGFVLDIYRPRAPGVEPRACFDSRLLALIAEPGGIASSIAEAINYQFGFEVSQTWFYRLLQRTFVPLLWAGLLMLWLLDCVVLVQPGQHVIIERFGKQLNATEPYEPGFYWKLPRPIDVASKYDTGRLHQIVVGFKQFDAEPIYEKQDGRLKATVALWTDAKHMGQPHWDFLIPAPPDEGGRAYRRAAARQEPRPPDGRQFSETALATGESDEPRGRQVEEALPVNMVRMDVAVQYKIREDRLAAYTQRVVNPHDTLRDLAWKEVVRYNASWDIFSLLGEKYGTAGGVLKERIARRVDELDLGLEVVYVGVQNVHPEPGVSKEFRKVVTAEQEKIASIREARVKENQVLSAVAGNLNTARAMALALDQLVPNTTLQDQAAEVLEAADPALVEVYQQRTAALAPEFTHVVQALWRLKLAQQREEQVRTDFELNLGQNADDESRAAEVVRRAAAALAQAEQALEDVFAPIRAAALIELDEATVTALHGHAQARFALDFWNGRLEEPLQRLQGTAAAILARAQADRWEHELSAAREVARLRGERNAYRAAPRIYKIRKYLEVLVAGIKDSRKFFLAFDPAGRQVRVRFIVEEQARPEIADLPTRLPK